MKKSILYSTLGILGSVSAAGVSVSAVYYTKYKNLKDGLDFSNSGVKINMYESLNDTSPVSKIYKVQKGEVNLADLMLNHKDNFKLKNWGPPLGQAVQSVFGVLANWTNGYSWVLASPTYVIDHPDTKTDTINGKKINIKNLLSVGVSKVILSNSLIINFYKAPNKAVS